MTGLRTVACAGLLALVTGCARTPAPRVPPTGVPASFVLLQPDTGQPAVRTPYRLTFDARRIVSAPPGVRLVTDTVAEGVTDADGRTGIVLLDAADDGDHTLLMRHGTGNFGTFFVLRDSDRPSLPVAGRRYRITGCQPGEQYEGTTDHAGRTVYYSSATPCDVSLYVSDQERISTD